MSKVTVVIPNYNGVKYIENCLNSLLNQTIDNCNIIVIDNASTDRSEKLVKEKYPNVQVVINETNKGFSSAVNKGIELANSKYVILLNNDTCVENDFVEKMLDSIEKSEKIFSVSAKMIQMSDKTKLDGAGDMYCALGWAYARYKGKGVQKGKRSANVFSACAGAAIYRKDAFLKIGMFDNDHFAYLEDMDIGYRARIFGYINKYEPGAIVYHVGSAVSGSRYNEFKVELSARNSIYLIYKNMPILQIIINLPLLLIGYLIKYLFFVGKGLSKQYIKGLKDGFILCKSEKGKANKVKFKFSRMWQYIVIQFELWINMVVRIFC